MSFTKGVAECMMPFAQNKSACQKSGTMTDAFHDQLTQMMQDMDTSVTVRQVQVTGTVMSNELGDFQADGSLKELTERLGYMLDMLFARNGIPKEPPVEVSFSYTRTEIRITGDRDDIEQIESLIKGDGEISSLIKNTLALADHVINMAESLRFQKEYRDSSDPDSVVDKYAYLFENTRSAHSASLRFGDSLSILSDGKNYTL